MRFEPTPASEPAPNKKPRRQKRQKNDGLRKRCDCGRRAWNHCDHPWWFSFKRGRVYKRVSLHKYANKPAGYHMPKEEAITLRDTLRGDIGAGKYGRVPAAGAPQTFSDLAALYLSVKPSKKFVPRVAFSSDVVYHVKALSTLLGSKALAALTEDDVERIREQWIAHRPGGKGGRVGANRLLSRLRHMLRWAVRKKFIDRSPFTDAAVSLDYAAEGSRKRRLEGNEGERLLKAANPFLTDLIRAALNTGCRKGELLSLQWADVKDRAIVLAPEKTKTRRERVIPINATLRDILDRRRVGPDGEPLAASAYVFGTETGEQRKSVREAWERACEAAEIKGLHFHDLRRELGSRLLESGSALHEVRDVLGHANITMTSRYLGTTDDRLENAFTRLEAAFSTGLAQSSESGEDPKSGKV